MFEKPDQSYGFIASKYLFDASRLDPIELEVPDGHKSD